MRLQDEGEPGASRPYASGGIVGIDGSDRIGIHISRCEPILTAADVRRMWDASVPEWFQRAISQPVSGVQEEVIGFAPPMSTWYDNASAQNVAYRLNVAIDRDSRLNNEEREEYDRTLAEMEFGPGFFRRAHP